LFFLEDLPYATSSYSSALTNNNTFFIRFYASEEALYYYEAIQMNFSKSGLYAISSDSTLDTFGLIYNNSFDQASADTNLLAWNDDRMDSTQFQILLNVDAADKHILVLTTKNAWEIGEFSIIARGPGKVAFSPAMPPGMS
jgi:hypothetical protein